MKQIPSVNVKVEMKENNNFIHVGDCDTVAETNDI